MFPALLCGNAVILKPAEDVPHTAHLLVELLLEAGLPPEVVQLVHGEGSVVGRAMVEHPDGPVISFTGTSGCSTIARPTTDPSPRSEEHTSELQSPCNIVCPLLLEKKMHNTT